LTQRSTEQKFPSSQSASLPQGSPGSVVVVVAVVTVVVVVEARQSGLQNSLGFRHGWSASHGSSLHWSSTVTKHLPLGGGGGQSATQASFGRQGFAGEQPRLLHFRVSRSRHVPVGGGVPQSGLQNSPAAGHGWSGPHASPVQPPALRSKQPPASAHRPSRRLQTPAARRRQSFAKVVPSQPQTGATTSGHAGGLVTHTPPD
jgi:hypothetical protein